MGIFGKKKDPELQGLLLNGGHDVRVVGESHYQDAISALCGAKTKSGVECVVTLLLMPEPFNEWDPKAVGVFANVPGPSQKVGHLSREAALAYEPIGKLLFSKGYVGAVRATIRGGWDRGGGDEGLFGITLDLASPSECLPDEF